MITRLLKELWSPLWCTRRLQSPWRASRGWQGRTLFWEKDLWLFWMSSMMFFCQIYVLKSSLWECLSITDDLFHRHSSKNRPLIIGMCWMEKLGWSVDGDIWVRWSLDGEMWVNLIIGWRNVGESDHWMGKCGWIWSLDGEMELNLIIGWRYVG